MNAEASYFGIVQCQEENLPDPNHQSLHLLMVHFEFFPLHQCLVEVVEQVVEALVVVEAVKSEFLWVEGLEVVVAMVVVAVV